MYDIMRASHWGGVISGDEVTIDWDLRCPCGRTTVAFEGTIVRYTEKKGGDDDRISCAATQEVQAEVIDFLRGETRHERVHGADVPTR